MKDKKYRNKNWLYQKYIYENLPTAQIAKICNLKSHVTIWNWLKKFNIPRRYFGNTLSSHPNWKGGTSRNFCYTQARKIWREDYGKNIPKGYVIHHIDKDITNNNIDNLLVLPSKKHRQEHNKGKNNPMYGKKHSKKTKRKISESMKRKI